MCDFPSNRYVVHVKGDIIVTDNTIQCAQSWACFGIASQNAIDNYTPQKTTEIESNLILNENRACIPYASYYSDRGIAGGGISVCPGYGPAVIYAKSELERIKSAKDLEVPLAFQESFYKGLYIECYSCLEQFLCDFVLCGIYNVSGCYERAVEYKNKKRKNCSVHDFYFTFVFHKICETMNMFKEVLQIDLPDMSFFAKQNDTRNDIVHRTSLRCEDRMTYRHITRQNLDEMIGEMEKLLCYLSVYC